MLAILQSIEVFELRKLDWDAEMIWSALVDIKIGDASELHGKRVGNALGKWWSNVVG